MAQDYINKVLHVMTNGGAVAFVIQTEGEPDFWWFEVDSESWFDYWKKNGNSADIFGANFFTPWMCTEFVNNCDDTIGCSCGSFETEQDAVKDYLSNF